MKLKKKYIIYGAVALGFLILVKMGRSAWYTITDWLIPEFEGFRASPYWDKNAWRWGYGTPAPGSSGTVTKEQARAEMRAWLERDYAYLSTLVKVPLSANQWAALLSFHYNTSLAENLMKNINAGNTAALQTQWLAYNKSRDSGGVLQPDNTLIRRRAIEWNVWQGSF